MDPIQGDSTSFEPTSPALERQFHQLGWCPHQFRRLQKERSAGTLHYLSSLDRRNYRPNDHDACSDYPGCIANNIKQGTYATKHTQECAGSCSFIGVDYDRIVGIIREGGVPIIGIQLDAASTLSRPVCRLSVTPRTISTRYTVISHVWFDGLGNPSANALPACQIHRLYKQLTSLPREHETSLFSIGPLQVDWWRQSFVLNPELQPPLFWMDTLCIPVDPKHEALRTKAINQMASIYAAAVRELVLDAELMQCEAGTTLAVEMLARMACSAWMTRSWTLQEGVLARSCVFQFKDCAIDPTHEWCLRGIRPGSPAESLTISFPLATDEEHWAVYAELYSMLWDTLQQDWNTSYLKDPPEAVVDYVKRGGILHRDKIYRLPAVEGLSDPSQDGLDETVHFMTQLGEEHRLKQLVDTWNELAQRSTTMPEDLHVIIANLLDFNADSIMRLPTREERMRAMILSFDLLPVSLFFNTGPKWCESANTSVASNNRWIPVEPSKSQLSLTPVMRVTAEWLELDLKRGSPGTQVVLLPGANVTEQTSFFCSIAPKQIYHVTLLEDRHISEQTITHSVSTGDPHYLIVESLTLPATATIKGALLRSFSASRSDQNSIVRLSYVCPVTLRLHEGAIDPNEQHTTAELLPSNTQFAVKYDPIQNYTRHPRRLTRGPTTQGGIVAIFLFPIPLVLGIACLIAFIITMARPPHTFSPTAKGLLAGFFVLYIGCSMALLAWLFFVSVWMYRMWLASFESEWVHEEQVGWWAVCMRLERWFGGVEHTVVVRVRRLKRVCGHFALLFRRGGGAQEGNAL